MSGKPHDHRLTLLGLGRLQPLWLRTQLYNLDGNAPGEARFVVHRAGDNRELAHCRFQTGFVRPWLNVRIDGRAPPRVQADHTSFGSPSP